LDIARACTSGHRLKQPFYLETKRPARRLAPVRAPSSRGGGLACGDPVSGDLAALPARTPAFPFERAARAAPRSDGLAPLGMRLLTAAPPQSSAEGSMLGWVKVVSPAGEQKLFIEWHQLGEHVVVVNNLFGRRGFCIPQGAKKDKVVVPFIPL